MQDIQELCEDNFEIYDAYLGKDCAEDMRREFFRGYGACREDGTPAGAMVYELIDAEKEDEPVKSRIRFLQADSEELLDDMQKQYLEEGISEEEISESFYWLEGERSAASCEKAGFSKERRESDCVCMTLKEAAEIPFFAKIKKLPGFICSLDKLTSIQYRLAIKNCLFKEKKGLLEDLGYLQQDWFETTVSACTITDDEASGLFLIRARASGILEPVLLTASGPDFQKHLAMMIAYAIKKGLETYPPETEIRIFRSRAETAALVKKLLPGRKGVELFFGNRKEHN